MASILIVGQDPDFLPPNAAPPGITPASIRAGLNTARDTLVAAGHPAEILWTTDVDVIARELATAVAARRYDVIVIGAGLRTLPPMATHFERLMNAILAHAPHVRLAFNSNPHDTADAALRATVAA